jgi:sporulation protein YlmC with PRC-barrel domain
VFLLERHLKVAVSAACHHSTTTRRSTMLRSLNSFQNHTLDARDGEIGKVHNFLFDDDSWEIRYLVADTTRWLPGRKVLISSIEIGQPDAGTVKVPVELSRDQIKSSPDIDADKPVSRQEEIALHRHFGWSYYWMQPAALGGAIMNPTAAAIMPDQPEQATDANPGNPHLRSVREVTGYHIEARDGRLGHIDDLIVDDETWTVRYLVVDTRNWWPGKKVLISPEWRVDRFDWTNRSVSINLSRETIQGAPAYDPAKIIDRAYEAGLHEYYKRPAYWLAAEELDARH